MTIYMYSPMTLRSVGMVDPAHNMNGTRDFSQKNTLDPTFLNKSWANTASGAGVSPSWANTASGAGVIQGGIIRSGRVVYCV